MLCVCMEQQNARTQNYGKKKPGKLKWTLFSLHFLIARMRTPKPPYFQFFRIILLLLWLWPYVWSWWYRVRLKHVRSVCELAYGIMIVGPATSNTLDIEWNRMFIGCSFNWSTYADATPAIVTHSRPKKKKYKKMFFLYFSICAFRIHINLNSIQYFLHPKYVRVTKKESTVCPVHRNNNNVCFDTFIVCLLCSYYDLYTQNSEEIATKSEQ